MADHQDHTSEFENAQAYREGWAIFDCDGSDNGRWQLCRIDEDEIFATDEAAWRHVWTHAEAGSAYHQAALAYLKRHNPGEYDCIARMALELSRA